MTATSLGKTTKLETKTDLQKKWQKPKKDPKLSAMTDTRFMERSLTSLLLLLLEGLHLLLFSLLALLLFCSKVAGAGVKAGSWRLVDLGMARQEDCPLCWDHRM